MAKKKKNEKLDVAREVLRDHPDADSRTLARLLHQKYPHHFSSIEVARSKIRYLRGAHGSRHRKVISDKTDFRKHGKTTATAGIEPANHAIRGVTPQSRFAA